MVSEAQYKPYGKHGLGGLVKLAHDGSEAQLSLKIEDMDCRACLYWNMMDSEAQIKPLKLKTWIAGPG